MSYPNDQRYGSVMGEPELDTSESFPETRKFQVWVGKSQPESDGFWHKAGDALKKVGRGVKDALPYLAEAAEAFGNSSSAYLPNDDSLLSMDTGLVLTNRSERTSRQRYLNADPINKYSSKPLANNRISQLSPPPLPKPSPRADWRQMQARTARILNSLASAKGLPSYEEFHREHGVVYDAPSQKSGFGIKTYLKEQAAMQSADFIREPNPEPLPKPQAPRRVPETNAEPRFQSADEILADFLQVMPARRLPKAEYQNRDEDRKQDLWPKIQAGQTLNDNEMKQLFLTLDIQHYQAQTEKEKLEAELLRQYAEQKLAENLVSQAGQNMDGQVLIGGVPVRPEDALYFAKQDIQHFRETDTHLRPDQLEALRTMSGRYKRTGKLQEPQPRVPVATKLREARTTGGSFRHIVRAVVPVEKKLAQIYPNNPNFLRGRLSNSAGQIKPGIPHNTNDVPLTYAGHALEKHGPRKLSNSTFPTPTGKNSNKNRLAQEIVDSILFDEATIMRKRSKFLKGRYPHTQEFIDIISDYGKGVGIRYKKLDDGKIIFNTFLEP